MNRSNATAPSTFPFGQCLICQTSYGFNAADLRAIILIVVFAAIALIGCYTGVLWFACRTRFHAEKDENIEMNHSYVNSVINEDYVERISSPTLPKSLPASSENLEKF